MRQIRNLISLCIVFIFSKDLIYPDCEQYVFNEIFREEFEGSFATRSGETIDSQNNFVVVDEETGTPVAGYSSTDRIYKLTIVSGDTVNLFVDMCRSGTDFDASVAIVKKEDGMECDNLNVDDLIISNTNSELGTSENIDAYALCPPLGLSLPEGISAWYLPIARDIYLEPGDYYIVVEGYSEGSSGNYNMIIGEMVHFTDFNLHPQNLFVDVNFSDNVYGVNDSPAWSLGTIDNFSDYFELKDESGLDINTGPIIDSDGNTPEPNEGYKILRFPLIDPPNFGASIFLTVKDHEFTSSEEGSQSVVAPHLVNSEGIPFSVGDTMYIDLNDIIAPTITIEGISVEDNTSIIDPEENIIISSTETLFKDEDLITAENLEEYLSLTFFDNGDAIPFSIEVNGDQTEIEIDPVNSLVDYQWQDIVLTLSNQNADGDSLTDEANNQIQNKTKNIRINDIVNPFMTEVIVDGTTNTLITIIMSEEIYKNFTDLDASGGLSPNNFDLLITNNELNNVQSIYVENVIKLNSFEPLVGGEDTLRLQLVMDPPFASGEEIVTVSTTFSPIYDRAGNQVLNQKTFQLKDELAPELSVEPQTGSTILPSNNFLLSFSETVKNFNPSDSSVTTLDNNIVKSIISLIDQNGDSLDYQASFNGDTTLITIEPDVLLTELGTVSINVNQLRFCDKDTNLISSSYQFVYDIADVSPPSFSEYSFGRGNDFILLTTSEGIYSDPDATQPVTSEDFELVVDYGDLNGSELIILESIADTSGGIPIAGETKYRMNLKVFGSSNGTESVKINPISNEVYDAGGNIMSASETTDEYYLLPSPTFDTNSSLSSDNGYFRLIFDDGPVFSDEASTSGLGIQDFKVLLTNLNGQVEDVFPLYVVDQNNNPLDGSGTDTIKLDVNLDFIPNGGEIIRIFPESSNAIFNSNGVNMDSAEFAGPFSLNDQLKPFYNLNMENGAINISYKDTIIFAFNEPIRLLNGQPLTDDSAMESFEIKDIARPDSMIVNTPGSTTIIPPDSAINYETFFTVVNDPSPDSIWVIMTQPFGSEHTMSLIIEDNFEDFSGNRILAADTIIFETIDNIAPDFVTGSARIDSLFYISLQNNPSQNSRRYCNVQLLIDDNIFTDQFGLNEVVPEDFLVEVIQEDGFSSSAIIENILLIDADDFESDSIVFQIKFDEVPSGKEKFFIRPANNNAIYDIGQNSMSADSTSDTLTTFDLRFPTIDSTSLEHEGFVDLMMDSTIIIKFSEPINVESFTYRFTSSLDKLGFKFDSRLESDSLTILLDSTIMSFDTLQLEVVYIEDTSGNVRDSLLSRRFFTKAAGDFSDPPDDRISLEDLEVFITSWNSNDFSKNLGPYIGNPPNIKISQDSLFGIDDGMAFTQMWRWSIEKYGPVYLADKNKNSSDIALLQISNDRISIFATQSVKYGQLILEYGSNLNSVNVIKDFQLNNNGVILNNINDDDGIAIIEFAISEDMNSPLGFDFESSTIEDIDVRVTYALFDSNYNLLDEKDSIVNRVYIPEKFSLKQNYPNPFNPKTTIRFSLPVDSNVELIIYDVNGKIVKEIINHNMETGSYKVVWDGTNKGGALVGSGVYFYRIKADNFIASQKMIFLK